MLEQSQDFKSPLIYIFFFLDSEEGLELRKSVLKTEKSLPSSSGNCFIQGCSAAVHLPHSVPQPPKWALRYPVTITNKPDISETLKFVLQCWHANFLIILPFNLDLIFPVIMTT